MGMRSVKYMHKLARAALVAAPSNGKRLLVAIISAHARETFATVIRETWLSIFPKDCGIDVVFFRGRGAIREPGLAEVWLDCEDGYRHLPAKVQAICAWALEHGYQRLLKCDDDVVVDPQRFLQANWDAYPFSGCYSERAEPYGFCYFLNAAAMNVICSTPLPPHGCDEGWVTTSLKAAGIVFQNTPQWYCWRRAVLRTSTEEIFFAYTCEDPNAQHWAYCIHFAPVVRHRLNDRDKLDQMRRVFSEKVLHQQFPAQAPREVSRNRWMTLDGNAPSPETFRIQHTNLPCRYTT